MRQPYTPRNDAAAAGEFIAKKARHLPKQSTAPPYNAPFPERKAALFSAVFAGERVV